MAEQRTDNPKLINVEGHIIDIQKVMSITKVTKDGNGIYAFHVIFLDNKEIRLSRSTIDDHLPPLSDETITRNKVEELREELIDYWNKNAEPIPTFTMEDDDKN